MPSRTLGAEATRELYEEGNRLRAILVRTAIVRDCLPSLLALALGGVEPREP